MNLSNVSSPVTGVIITPPLPLMSARSWKNIANFDIFPKVDRTFTRATAQGGAVTVTLSILMFLLLCADFYDFMTPQLRFEYQVDNTDLDSGRLSIHLDLTVAMECQYLTIIMADAGGGAAVAGDKLHVTSEPLKFNNAQPLHAKDNHHQQQDTTLTGVNVRKLIANAGSGSDQSNFHIPDSWSFGSLLGLTRGTAHGCRVRGELVVNKVTGKLQITASGHGLFGPHTPHSAMNFTHRFDRLQFGPDYPGLVNPLDQSIQITDEVFTSFTYQITIVPTIYTDSNGRYISTSQYAVTEMAHKTPESQAQGGGPMNARVPGILISYDIDPVLVTVVEEGGGWFFFLIRSFGVVGGVWTCAGGALRLASMLGIDK